MYQNDGFEFREEGNEELVLFCEEPNPAIMSPLPKHKGGKKWPTKKQKTGIGVPIEVEEDLLSLKMRRLDGEAQTLRQILLVF